ncbi:hypothetical protein [Streptomyces sp. PSKA30]|uniref:hypothetical protein n=1 Tax=Streptomyces sp. PSKA30 TaxID=2874597 RepID=UPI001CD14FB3|nr:hypothetical protein [Streptomyces sp. PSKA30]MBZ9638109.1 hypothetical protein [Streptomyces sp. PSKA30]
MPQFNEDAARQAETEQAHVSAMYHLLDERLADLRAQLTDVLRSQADSAGEVCSEPGGGLVGGSGCHRGPGRADRPPIA